MEVGDYVRTKYGEITKIKEIWENERIFFEKIIILDYMTTDSIYVSKQDEYIIKSSPKIIDLIEVGDYVNGILINDITIYPNGKVVGNRNSEDLWEESFKNDEIKSIVTKEQFSQMEYKIEEE